MSDSYEPHAPRGRRPWRWGLLACLPIALAAMFFCSGCDSEAPAAHGTKKPKVVVTTPITDRVMDYQDFTGRLDAVKTVDLRARVSGYITEAPFKEGDHVKAGELLFQIDIRPYKADLVQAEANLKLAVAEREYQMQNAERQKQMFARSAASSDDIQKATAERDKAIATVGAFEAARDKAKLYLDYTHVIAPVSGRVSRRQVDPGNLVNADNTVLTTIVTEDPMWGYFDVDERTYLNLLGQLAPGLKSWSEELSLPVLMSLATEKDFKRIGAVNFVDNRVAATTGTVKMRGRFDNAEGTLKAGMFARFRLPLGSAYDAIIIPDEAIQSDQERKYVWVVNKNNEVEYRSVQLGQAIGELRVIRPPEKGKEGKAGLSEGERIIISGMQRVRKGTQVEVQLQPPPAPPHMALVRLIAEGKKR
jgi:multidrug efflux system membrane fusion protein